MVTFFLEQSKYTTNSKTVRATLYLPCRRPYLVPVFFEF